MARGTTSDQRWQGNIWDALAPEIVPESPPSPPPESSGPLPADWPAPPSPEMLAQDFVKRSLAAVTTGGSVDPFGPAWNKWLQQVTLQVITDRLAG